MPLQIDPRERLALVGKARDVGKRREVVLRLAGDRDRAPLEIGLDGEKRHAVDGGRLQTSEEAVPRYAEPPRGFARELVLLGIHRSLGELRLVGAYGLGKARLLNLDLVHERAIMQGEGSRADDSYPQKYAARKSDARRSSELEIERAHQ